MQRESAQARGVPGEATRLSKAKPSAPLQGLPGRKARKGNEEDRGQDPGWLHFGLIPRAPSSPFRPHWEVSRLPELPVPASELRINRPRPFSSPIVGTPEPEPRGGDLGQGWAGGWRCAGRPPARLGEGSPSLESPPQPLWVKMCFLGGDEFTHLQRPGRPGGQHDQCQGGQHRDRPCARAPGAPLCQWDLPRPGSLSCSRSPAPRLRFSGDTALWLRWLLARPAAEETDGARARCGGVRSPGGVS